MDLQAVILAAGKGRRLKPITLTHSKAMTPILGVPIIQRIIEALSGAGFQEFIVVRSPQDLALEALLKELNEKRDLKIKICIQAEPKGTADALLSAKNLIKSDFLLSSCDNLFPENHFQKLIEQWRKEKPLAIFTLGEVKPGALNQSAGVRLKGNQVIEFQEKPGENSGQWEAIAKFLFLLKQEVVDYLEQVRESRSGEKEVQEAIRMMLKKYLPQNKAIGIFAEHYFHLSSVQDLLEIYQHYFIHHKPFSIHPQAQIEPEVEIQEPVMIEPGAIIRKGSKIGPMVYIGKDAQIGREVQLKRCIIYPKAKVPDKVELKDQVVLK